jgi:hypothetical protein
MSSGTWAVGDHGDGSVGFWGQTPTQLEKLSIEDILGIKDKNQNEII